MTKLWKCKCDVVDYNRVDANAVEMRKKKSKNRRAKCTLVRMQAKGVIDDDRSLDR